jgi:hypothetical protein
MSRDEEDQALGSLMRQRSETKLQLGTVKTECKRIASSLSALAAALGRYDHPMTLRSGVISLPEMNDPMVRVREVKVAVLNAERMCELMSEAETLILKRGELEKELAGMGMLDPPKD